MVEETDDTQDDDASVIDGMDGIYLKLDDTVYREFNCNTSSIPGANNVYFTFPGKKADVTGFFIYILL